MMDNSGWSVLAVSIRSGQPGVAWLLLERGANALQTNIGKRTALHEAAERGDNATVNHLLNRKVDVDAQDHLMRTALHVAAKTSSEIVDVLLQNGAKELPMRDLRMPLHVAAGEGGQKGAAELLLKRRHEVDPRDHQGDTPLMLAALTGHFAIVQLLLVWCADVLAQNSYGRTATDYARDSAISQLVENAGELEGRCQCDCGPYSVGVQFRTFGWKGGCSGTVMCRSGDGGRRQAFACQKANAAEDSKEILGRWTPSAPGFSCPTVLSRSEQQQHAWSFTIFVVMVVANSR